MPRVHRFLWTNNEMLAHQKNLGEEVRLRNAMDLIHRRMYMATSGVDVELQKVHTELKAVRTSTGHSVMALPPKPFRKHRQRQQMAEATRTSRLPAISTLPSNTLLSMSGKFPDNSTKNSTSSAMAKMKSVSPVPLPFVGKSLGFATKKQKKSTDLYERNPIKNEDGVRTFSHTAASEIRESAKHNNNNNNNNNNTPTMNNIGTCVGAFSETMETQKQSTENSNHSNSTTTNNNKGNSKLSSKMNSEEEFLPMLPFKDTTAEAIGKPDKASVHNNEGISYAPPAANLNTKRRVSISLPGQPPVHTREISDPDFALLRPHHPPRNCAEGGVVLKRLDSPVSQYYYETEEQSKMPSANETNLDEKLVTSDREVYSLVHRRQSGSISQRTMLSRQTTKSSLTEQPDDCSLRDDFAVRETLSYEANENLCNELSSDYEPFSRKPSAPTLSDEISKILDAVRDKNRQLLGLRKSITSLDALVPGRTGRDERAQAVPERPRWMSRRLPHTRYRCRTCLARLRDDLQFRQAKRFGRTESRASVSKDAAGHGRHAPGRLLSRRPTLVSKEVDLSDDSDDEDAKSTNNHKIKHHTAAPGFPFLKPKAQGYSRKRLEKLAEPRGGAKPKIMVSGRVLRRQAEVLRRPHEMSQISEREMEQRQRLQARVRLFLAMVQQRRIPVTMPHIPQRDDIMKVDISHIGKG